MVVRVAGQDGPLLYPGPLCGGEVGTTGRVAGVDRDVGSFSPAHGDGMDAGVEATQERLPDVLSKSPATAHGLAAQGWAASAKWGVVFSWILLFWTSKREVPRVAQRHESSASEIT
jgi:hypothetical protein